MRVQRRLAVLLVAVAVAAAGSVTIGAPAMAAGVTVTFSRTTDLIDRDVVTIDFRDIPIVRSGAVAACQTVAVDLPQPDDCLGNTFQIGLAPSGSATVQVRVQRRTFSPALGRTVDCIDPAEHCVISLFGNNVTVPDTPNPITFATPPAPPVQRGTLTVDPPMPPAFSTATLTGSGFRPDAAIELSQCTASPADMTFCALPRFATADAAGQFTAQIEVTHEVINDHSFDRSPCTEAPQQCAFYAAERIDPVGTFVFTNVTVTAPPPAVAVTPATGIHRGETVAVRGRNLRTNTGHDLLVCAHPPAGAVECADQPAPFTFTDDRGAFDTTFAISRVVGGLDCALPAAGFCDLVVRRSDDPGLDLASARLTFSAYRVDTQIRRRSDGVLLGDDVYEPTGVNQTRAHRVAPGDKWTFAIRVENDGAVTDDIRVRALLASANAVPVRYFSDFFDVGATITGSGLVFRGVAPGEARIFAVRFDPAATAPVGATSSVRLVVSSDGDPVATDALTDAVVVRGVVAPAPN